MHQLSPKDEELTKANREYLMRCRQALIIKLGAIEDYMGMERSITPRHKRKHPEQATGDEPV